MNPDRELAEMLKEEFRKSREGAILKCAAFMTRINRRDIAKQMLEAAEISRFRLEQIKTRGG